MTSTTVADALRSAPSRAAQTGLVVAFWVAVWHVAALAVGQDLLLASPQAVLVRLAELLPSAGFWFTVGHTFWRIAAGFAAAAAVGVGGAALAAGSRVVDALITPLIATIRTTPVVSFIILVLMWADSAQLALVISFMLVMPVFYTNVLAGIRHRDRALLEVATVFDVAPLRRVAAIDVPAVLPFFVAGARIGVGLAWKSGVTAEVIGLPQGSIGERLYEAKIFLSTADLLAWTVVIVALSFLCERLVLVALAKLQRRLSTGQSAGARVTRERAS